MDKAKLTIKHKNKYMELVTKYRKMPLVLSHNDLSTANLLVRPNHEIIFIDYE
jgi:thiamine kinase-like enzyme